MYFCAVTASTERGILVVWTSSLQGGGVPPGMSCPFVSEAGNKGALGVAEWGIKQGVFLRAFWC